MASVTSNLSLAKCDINDKITPTWINQNFDTIDQEIGDLKKAYVVSYGSSDGWTWRIWSNGIAESWKTLDQMFTLSQWGNVGVAHFEVSLPSIYKEKPNVQVSCEDTAVWLMVVYGVPIHRKTYLPSLLMLHRQRI